MRNLCLTISYDGTHYVGWQVQPNGVSIKSTIEDAICKLTGASTNLLTAGRTDSGVHAIGQVASFQTESKIPCNKIQTGLQTFLPNDIVIRDVKEVPLEFHATYSAKRKRYRYLIHNSKTINPFVRRYAWRYSGDIDTEAMHRAAQQLLGTHDFRSFESHYPNKSTSVRTIEEVTVNRYSHWAAWSQTESLAIPPTPDGEFIWIETVADGFLYNMVRAIVGTLLAVGRGKKEEEDIPQILQAMDRAQAGETAPACGLYLVHVDYGEETENRFTEN